LPNTTEFKYDSNGIIIQTVVMSEPGVGKTVLACTFPRPNVMDFDEKVMVMRNPEVVKKYGLRSVEYQSFPEKGRNSMGFVVTPNALDDACRYFDLWMKPGKRDQFDTWIIDSGTALSEVARNKALQLLGAANRSKTFAKAQMSGAAVMEQADWGAERSIVEQFIRMVKESGKNVVVNVHIKEITSDAGVIIQRVPLFTGQSSKVIPSMFKDVWLYKNQGVGATFKRILTSTPDGIDVIRSELGIGELINPTYDTIIERIKTLQDEVAKQITPRETNVKLASS
jgi:hypothetical protein